MASGGGEVDDGGILLDIHNVHRLLQVEHEQIQKRTFTNWINAQLAKRCPPSFVSDLFADIREGSQLLDLLEVMSSQPMKRQRGRGVFQQRANIETALNFLKKKSVKLVNINIPDIIDGRPSIILGLIWTIILHCHIEELASTLSYSSCHSSLDSLASLDSWSGSPLPSSPAPLGRTSPLHRRFRLSAKKALLMWVRDQCLKVGCSISVKNFNSSWRSGEAFLAILCSLRPQLADLSLVQSRSNRENLEEAFHLAERELHIPRLLEPEDVDVRDPDEKSIMTYVAQFLQYSNDMPAPDDHLQVSSTERALEVTSWLQRAHQELSEARAAAENSSFVEKYQVLQSLAGSFNEQRRPVMTLLAAIRRCPELSREQCALRTAWDCLEKELQRCKVDLDSSLPPPLDSVVVWLQRAEASLTEEGGRSKDHADAAKEARARQDAQKTLMKEMSYFVNIIATFHNTDDLGNAVVPIEKFNEIKRSLTNIRVTAKYEGIKLEYQESRHTVLDLLGRVNAKVVTWKAPYGSQEAVLLLLQDWHETVERHGLLLILMDALQNLKEKANTYTSKAALGEDAQRVARQLKESESEAELVTRAVASVRGTMERAACVWETYNKCLVSLQTWLAQNTAPPTVGTQDMSEWTSCQARLNEAGNVLIEVTESSASLAVAEQLSKVNRKWAEHVKRTMFAVPSEPSVGPRCLQMVHSLTQEASGLLRTPLQVSSASLKANRQKLQLLSRKMAEVDLSSLGPSQCFQTSDTENLPQHLPKMLGDAERACGELQRAASGLEGRLAELDHWSTEAVDCCQHRGEKKHRRSAWESAAKVLISRGVQLEKQVVTEAQDLQDLVARVQTTSPLLHLSTSGTQDRISEAVSHCQEILEMFGSLGFRQHVKSAHQTWRQPEAGLFVVAKTKRVDQIGNVQLAQDRNLVSPELSSQTSRQRALHGWAKSQNGSTAVNPCVETQVLPGPLREPIFHVHSPLTQTIKEAEPEHMILPETLSQRHAQASSWSDYDQILPASIQTPFGLNSEKTPKSPVSEEEQRSETSSQTCVSESRMSEQPHSVQRVKPPVVVRSEVHSKAQSMARSRLEKARFRLQGRIQQAFKLFGGREVSESEVKRKQRALRILQPVFMDEFLGAVEGLRAFSTGPQLQDLMLLSDSVRMQWEEVRREMAAFVPILWSKIREGKQSSSVVPCETQTNALHEAHEHTDHDSLPQQQAVTQGAASVEVESLRELCATLTPRRCSCLATDQLKESDEDQEIHPSDTVLPPDRRGRRLRGAPPLRVPGESADTRRSNSLTQEQSADRAQRRHVSPVSAGAASPPPPRGEVTRLRSQDDPTLLDKERLLKARLWPNQAHIQVVVRGNTVETEQEAEWTVLPGSAAAAAAQEKQSSKQEALERYRKSCVIFKFQLQKNKQHLEEFISDPVTISALQNRKKQLQALKQETDALWFEYELQCTQQTQFHHLMSKEDKDDMERDREQLTQQWRGQEVSLQSRVTSLEITAGLMALVTERLDRLTRESVDVSSFTVADPRLVSDLKEMDEALRSELRKLSERASEEEIQSHPPRCQAFHSTVHHLELLRRLEEVQTAAQALDHFLVTVREVEAETPTSRQPNEAEREQGTHAWQAAVQQKLLTAAKQSDSVDSTLKAAGMTLTMDGARVTCRDVVTSLSRQAVNVEEEVARDDKRESEDDLHTVGREKIQALKPMEEEEEEEVELVAKSSSRPERDDDVNSQRHEEHEAQTRKSGEDALDAVQHETRRGGGSIWVKKEGEESFVHRRVAWSSSLKEIREAAEQLRLQELTLPALQHRTRALTKLHSRLAVHLAELQHAQDAASQSGIQDASPTREAEDAWEEATKAVNERLEQCDALTELLKRFQSIHGELSGTLQRAESTIREQASYMGKDNLQRLHTKVQETKAELIGLGDGIEEVRSVCRQLHTHLRQIPECLSIPFEDETEAVMDRWLDVSEKTDSYLENLNLGLTLWDGIIQLGAAVDSWTSNKLAVVAQCPSFQAEKDIRALQSEIVTQEDNIERFHRQVAEIPPLLQSTEPPLELQVVETQMRKKMKQLKELVSEAEDLYRQKEAAKGQITARMAECFNFLQEIQEALLTLSASDVPTVLAKLKGLLFELQTRDEQAESLLQDLRVMASTAGAGNLHSLPADGTRLQDEVRNAHQLFSEVEEQTERNIRALDRLQSEGQHLEQWLQGVEGKAATDENLGLLQEEALEQRARTQALDQLLSSLQSSTLRQSALLEESSELLKRYRSFQTGVLRGPTEEQSSVRRDVEARQTPSKSTQSLGGDRRQTPDSPLGENHVPHPRAAVSEMADDEAHLQALRVTGNSLSDRAGTNQDFQGSSKGSMQKSEAARRDRLQPGRSCHSVLQVDPDLTSTFLHQIRRASSRVEEPQRRTAQLPSLFPGSRSSERKHVCHPSSPLQDEAESLQFTPTRPAEQQTETAERTSEKDPSVAELETRCSSLMDELTGVCSSLEQGVCNEEHFGKSRQDCCHKLTSLQEKMSACQAQKESSAEPITDAPALQEVTGIEKELLQIITVKDSITVSSSGEDQASLSEQASHLQDHKRSLDSSVRGGHSLLTDKNKQRVQREKGEVTCLQTNLKEPSENPCGNSEVSPDLTQLKRQRDTIQDCDTGLTELGARAGESSSTREILPADVTLTVVAVAKDLDRLKKQACAENTGDVGSEVINQLQHLRQTVQADLSSPSQVSPIDLHPYEVELDKVFEEVFRSEIDTPHLASHDTTMTPCPPAPPSAGNREKSSELGDQKDNKCTEKETMEPTKEQKLTIALPKIDVKNFFVSNKHTHTMDTDGNPLSRGFRKPLGNKTLISDSLPTASTSLIALQENTTEIQSQHLSAQQETFETVAREKDKHCEDICVRPHKVFAKVSDSERPQFQLQDNVGACSPDALRCSQKAKICDAQLTKSSSVPDKKSEGFTTSPDPESHETDLEIHYTESAALRESPVANSLPRNPLAFVASEFEDINSTDATLLCRGKSESQALMHGEGLSCAVAERQHAAETTSPDVRREETTHFCHAEDQTPSSVLCTGEVDHRNATRIPAADNKQLTVAAGTGQFVRADGGSPESLQCKLSKVPKRRVKALLPLRGSEREVTALLEDRQPQTRDGMQPERTAPDPPAGEHPERRATVRSALPEIQSSAESSSGINRTPQIDFNWHLKSFTGESEIRLVRAVQNVLACRYQPAQLDISAMAKQLQEAEDCRRRVQEQVATMKSMSGAGICDPDGIKGSEGQWSAALLDASATVQVKAAQLDQVKEYHKRMKITRAFLEVVAAERDKMSLSTLRSSALQADKLQALLQAVVQKKDTMEELLQLSRRFSVHLSDAESSGALLAQLGDVQEEWRLLEGSIKRALQHASSSTSQCSLLIREAEQLKANLDALRPSSSQSRGSRSALELVGLSTDVKLYNQLYMHLQSQTDALVHFTLGQKEKDELSRSLKDLGSLLNVTKAESKLDPSSDICGGISSTKINKQLQDLIIWAKQAEIHISVGKKLALFPEEARVQIFEMKKFQTDIWFRRSQMQTEVEKMKAGVSDMENEESDQVLQTTQDLYEAIADSLNQVLDTMKKNLQERETLLCQFASIDAWLAEVHAQRDPCAHVDNVSKADIGELQSELKSHKLAAVEIEAQLQRVDAMADACREIAVCSSPGESRYLVNRLSGLWTELRGLLAHEEALSWESEELIHELTTSNEESSGIRASLKQISTDLVEQRFPLTRETLSATAHLSHTLMEHQCQVRGLKQFREARRSSLLCTIRELQDQCKALSINAVEQEKYLYRRRRMVESRDVLEEQIQRAKDESVSVAERVMLCQSLLVELPLVKTQCQEVADRLETIARELEPSDLNPEKERIHRTVEDLVSWEHSVTDDIKSLEAKLLLGLRFSTEHPALMELFQRTRVELEEEEPVTPDEQALDIALRRNLIIWRRLESGVRVLEGLGRKEEVDLKNFKELYSLRDATMQDCHLRMEGLCQARESLKDYNWAAQGAICFLHNAEATFLSAPGGFLDCTEEQTQTQQALRALEDGFQAHICHLADLVPNQPCLSRPKTEQLHISILSQLVVGRAVLEAQAQLRMESLRRCEVRHQSHRKCHEYIRQRLSGFEIKLSECATEQVTSSDKSIAQQKRATLLLEGLLSLAAQLDELRAGCPAQSCGVGKEGELGALWRRWMSLRRGVGILIARTEQRGEEWKDITTSLEQCCSLLVRLQSEVPDSSTVSFSQEEPLELLERAEMHRARLEQEQQALSSLEHRLEHALALSSTQEPTSPGPVAETLVKLQDKVKSLKERNLLVVAAARAEDEERQQVQLEIAKWEQNMLTLLPSLEACPNLCKQQVLRQDLSTQKDKLKCIMDGVQSRYAEIPAGISRQLQEAQLSLQRGEDKLMEKSNRFQMLDSQVAELVSGLERFGVLLEQSSPTVNEAQNAIKHVWDELDAWHSRLMLLASQVQDLAEEHPDQAHLLMDQLNRPLQLYQNAAQRAEQRTAFLSKVPACLQEFEDIMHGATCWLDEAQSWLSAPCSFPTARGLQNHANSLQLVLDDSERIRHTLQAFRPVLDEISAVCDVSTHKERVNQNDQRVQKMQCKIQQLLEQILPAVGVVEAIEAELKTIEKNVPKIRAILSSVDDTQTTLTEHLQNRQVILANVQSMQRTLEEMERCKAELHLPQGARESLVVFSRARLLLQPLEELQQLTHQQAALLQNKIREEQDKWNDLGTIAVSGSPEEVCHPDRSLQKCKVQEAFELPNSEEEEEDENHSCHSSSSDTLTCSIPEDPEETLSASDGEKNEIAQKKQPPENPALESLAGAFTSEVKTSSKCAEVPGLLSGNHRTTEPESENVETGLIETDSIVGEIVTIEPPDATANQLSVEDKCSAGAAKLDSHGSPQCESPVTEPHAAAAAAENTRLIHARPKTPFTDGFMEEADKLVYSSIRPHQHLNTPNVSEKRREESSRALEMSEKPISIADQEADHEEDKKGELRWSQLNTQILQKLITLKKVKDGHQIGSEDRGTHDKDPERELTSPGSASAVLLRTHESITMMRRIVSFPGVNDSLYEAARKVLVCLDALTDLLLTPGEDEPQLRLLQQECVSTELVALCEMWSKVESGATPTLSMETPEALRCLTSLRECVQVGRLVSTSSHNQLIEHQEHASSQLCNLDEFEVEPSEMFPNIKDVSILKQCVQGRHQRESPGLEANLQQVSRALLRGIANLLELGEECVTEEQMSRAHNCSQLQAIRCRHKKLLGVLRSQLAFVQHLFQREAGALKCQKAEQVQLEVRAEAVRQQAVQQDVAYERRIEEWMRFEDNSGRLGGLLDDVEAFISSGEPEGDNGSAAEHRQAACQQALVRLADSRAALGLLLDQRKALQTDPEFAAKVGHAAGALELRWLSTCRRTEQESRRCRDIQDSQDRFQTDFASVSEWLAGAKKYQKIWTNLANTPDLNQECVCTNLITLLDFSMEMEAMSVQRASASREATKLLRLREADCPELRAQLAQLEDSWTQLTSDLSTVQDSLLQQVLAAWPPVQLLSHLEDWRKKLERRLRLEKETLVKAEGAAQITENQQRYQELKAGVLNVLFLLDFLCQSGPQPVGLDVRSERTVCAEQLGALRLRWLHLQGELECQTREAEQAHHTCADRERRLQRLHGWMEQQEKQLNQWKQPCSHSAACEAVLELEAAVSKVKEGCAALEELKSIKVEKEEDRPCDVLFSGWTESVCRAYVDLSQQMEALQPALQLNVDEWSCYESDLVEVSIHTARVRCALQHQPLYSLGQAEGHQDLLEQLEDEVRKGENLWVSVDKSHLGLVEKVHPGTAQALDVQMRGERKRWKDVVQELANEHTRNAETIGLWREFTQRSDRCSLDLLTLWRQWEELWRSSPRETQDMVHSVEKLQKAAEDLQSSVVDVLGAFKPLIGRLEPLATNIIQSETRKLSREVLLLIEATSAKKKSLQEDLEQQQLFRTLLEALETQAQSTKHKLLTRSNNTDSKQAVSELSDLFPSLVDVREMSCYVILTDHEAERLDTLSREWVQSMTRASDINRELQAERQCSQSFQEKCESLAAIQEKIEEESMSEKCQSIASLRDMMTAHKRLEAEIIIGNHLVHGLLCHALESMETERGGKSSELMAQVSRVRESWFRSLALAGQCRSSTKEQLGYWRVYQRGSKLLCRLLREADPLLSSAGPAEFTVHQLPGCTDDDQCVKDALGLNSSVFTRTLGAGRQLRETMAESECQRQLQSELQALQDAWERTASLLEMRRDRLSTAVQKWTECQDTIASVTSELEELRTRLKQPAPKELQDFKGDKHIQEADLLLQHFTGGFGELATMKTDMSQYVAAGDSALLEQQLEQLHSQWEELCTKVSWRRQEIADRLNAWTIFNDKNKEFCDWLTQMENKVCHSGEMSIEEMVEKLKKDCMEEINLFSENKSHLKQLGEQLLLASDEAKRTQVHGSLQEVNQRWHNLFHQIEARVKKLKQTLVAVQQLDKNMSNLRSWLSRIEAELSRPVTYSTCHLQEIQRRLVEQQELQRDIEQHTEGVVSVLSLCDVLLRDGDAAGGIVAESDSLQETSSSLDQRWRAVCAIAVERRLRIEETWRLWCKFLDDYSRFEDWLKMAERTAANPNSADVLYTVAKEELKRFEAFQRQVHERLTQLELVNNQYRRLARENRTDRASQLKAMVHEGNRRWDTLHRRVSAILRRLKHFTGQREEFEGTRESMLVWLTELDLQLTNVEHFSESDVHHKIQQLNSFQKEITVNTERIDELIVFGEGLIQKSSLQDAALIEDELEELHSYCQEVFSRLVRFHQRLSQPPMTREELALSGAAVSLESSLELICRPWLMRSQGSLPATPTRLLASPLGRSGRETPASVDSLPLEWDHTGDVGGSSSHEDEEEEEEEEQEDDRSYFSAPSVLSTSMPEPEPPRWRSQGDTEAALDSDRPDEAPRTLTSTPLKQGYLLLMSDCSGSIEDIKRVSLILNDEEQQEDLGLTGLCAAEKHSGVVERWELLQAQSRSPKEARHLPSDLNDITSWLEKVTPELKRLQSEPAASIEDMASSATKLKEMQRTFTRYKSIMLSVNLRAQEAAELEEELAGMNRDWGTACAGLQQWESRLRETLMRCKEFHERLHSLLLWLAHAESRRYAADISDSATPVAALRQHLGTLTDLQQELRVRQTQQASLQALWCQLQPEDEEQEEQETDEAEEKLHVTRSKLKWLLREVERDLGTVQQRLDGDAASDVQGQNTSAQPKKGSSPQRGKRDSPPPRSFFYRVLRAAFPLHLLFVFLLLLPCLIPLSDSDAGCTGANNFARSFYPMLRYTNGPPPT